MISIGSGEVGSMMWIVVLEMRRNKRGTDSDWSEKWEPQGKIHVQNLFVRS